MTWTHPGRHAWAWLGNPAYIQPVVILHAIIPWLLSSWKKFKTLFVSFQEILMIKGFCNFIGWDNTLAYNLKLSQINYEKLLYFTWNWSDLLLRIIFSLWMTQDYLKVCTSLTMAGNVWAHPTKKNSPKCYFSLVNIFTQIDALFPKTRAFWSTTCDPEFLQIWGLHKKTIFHFRLLPAKSNGKIPRKVKKVNFGQTWVFPENTFLLLCWISKNEQIPRKAGYTRTEERTQKSTENGWISWIYSYSLPIKTIYYPSRKTPV